MGAFFENLPEIIAEAARSRLGILALMTIALAFLAFFFFRKASETIRVGTFVLMLGGVATFYYSGIDEEKELRPLDSEHVALRGESNSTDKEISSGDRVIARYSDGHFYSGTVLEIGVDRYRVGYDSAIDRWVEKKFVVLSRIPQAELKEGQQVYALIDKSTGRWSCGIVLDRQHAKYLVSLSDTGRSTWVSMKDIIDPGDDFEGRSKPTSD